RDDVGVMLADDLADGAKLLGFAEVRTKPPDDLAVAADDREQAGFPAADDDVAWRKAHVALVEPPIRSNVVRRVDVQPVEAAACLVEALRRLDRLSRSRREPQFVDMVAGHPFPEELTLPRHFDEAIVFEHDIGDLWLHAIGVSQDQCARPLDYGCALRRVIAGWKALALPVMMLPRRPDRAALACLDLLVVRELPNHLSIEILLDQLQRLLVGRTRAAGRDEDATR